MNHPTGLSSHSDPNVGRQSRWLPANFTQVSGVVNLSASDLTSDSVPRTGT